MIEVMIVVAIIGILAAIAVPSYQSYIQKGRAKAASSDLMGLSLVVENRFQKTLAYPTAETTSTSATIAAFTGWNPSQSSYFTYSYAYTAVNGSAPEFYRLTATGTGTMSCTLTFTSPNTRAASGNSCGFSTW